MILEELRLQNFRSFGPTERRLRFSTNFTALIGANGSGKTAALLALCRMFGTNRRHRRIVRQDFHISHDEDVEKVNRELALDAIFSFPELCEDEADNSLFAVPEFFQQMTIRIPGEVPRIRIRLQAKWWNDGTYDGTIEEEVRWIMTLDEQIDWDGSEKVWPNERSRIQFIYIPVDRSTDTAVTNLLKGRLWKSAKWSGEFRSLCAEAIENVQNMFKEELPTKLVVEHLDKRWKDVNTAETDTNAILRIIDSDVDSFVKNAEFSFLNRNNELERKLDDLSDGQRSLFYIALTYAALELEQNLIRFPDDNCPFGVEDVGKFYHTILSIEEPENSISPFLLSRAIKQARHIASLDNAQVVVSSHSPAILGRVEVDDIRHFRLEELSKVTDIRKIELSDDSEESLKYIRLAVKAYPELYFARFVILCEGETEQIVIRRIAEAMGTDLDPLFVPVVPLAGRFAKHYWRLLDTLNIPFATLLDYDLGRKHGGIRVVQGIVNQLVSQGMLEDGKGVRSINATEDKKVWENDKFRQRLFNWLNDRNIYISYPLDIDMCMLKSYREAYSVTQSEEMTSSVDSQAMTKRTAKEACLGSNTEFDYYDESWDNDFFWYRRLFVSKSKPQSHTLALTRVSNSDLKSECPDVLKKIITKVNENLDVNESRE